MANTTDTEITVERFARLEQAVAQLATVVVDAALGGSKWRHPHAELDELIAEQGVPRFEHDVTVAANDRFGQRGGV